MLSYFDIFAPPPSDGVGWARWVWVDFFVIDFLGSS